MRQRVALRLVGLMLLATFMVTTTACMGPQRRGGEPGQEEKGDGDKGEKGKEEKGDKEDKSDKGGGGEEDKGDKGGGGGEGGYKEKEEK